MSGSVEQLFFSGGEVYSVPDLARVDVNTIEGLNRFPAFWAVSAQLVDGLLSRARETMLAVPPARGATPRRRERRAALRPRIA